MDHQDFVFNREEQKVTIPHKNGETHIYGIETFGQAEEAVKKDFHHNQADKGAIFCKKCGEYIEDETVTNPRPQYDFAY